MRVVIQRVSHASVEIDGRSKKSIKEGLLILLGIHVDDQTEDVLWLTKKIASLRIFGDEQGKMNKNVKEINGELLIVSQFTLYAQTRKGSRPSFKSAASPGQAIPLYEYFLAEMQKQDLNIVTGEFGADMKVNLLNDGPVTIILDSKLKEI